MEDLSTTQCAALKKKYNVVVDKVGHNSISYKYFVNEVREAAKKFGKPFPNVGGWGG